MDLSVFDDKCVRVVLRNGEVFEGACIYNNAEYNEAEFGRSEDCLDIACTLVFESEILGVTEIGDDGFSSPYGKIEEMTVEDGLDMVEEVLESDEPRNIIRLLLCIEERRAFYQDKELRQRAASLFGTLERYSEDSRVAEKSRELFELYSAG